MAESRFPDLANSTHERIKRDLEFLGKLTGNSYRLVLEEEAPSEVQPSAGCLSEYGNEWGFISTEHAGRIYNPIELGSLQVNKD